MSLGIQRGSAVSERNEKRDLEEDEWDYTSDLDFSELNMAFPGRPKKRSQARSSRSAKKFNIRIRHEDIILLDALSTHQGISRAALLNKILHDIMRDALMSWKADDARVFLAKTADEKASRTLADLGAHKRRTGDRSGARAEPWPPTPETISALRDLVKAGKTASQAAEHLGIDLSTYDESVTPWVNSALSEKFSEIVDGFDNSSEETYRSEDFLRLHRKLAETTERSRKGNLRTRQAGDHQK